MRHLDFRQPKGLCIYKPITEEFCMHTSDTYQCFAYWKRLKPQRREVSLGTVGWGNCPPPSDDPSMKHVTVLSMSYLRTLWGPLGGYTVLSYFYRTNSLFILFTQFYLVASVIHKDSWVAKSIWPLALEHSDTYRTTRDWSAIDTSSITKPGISHIEWPSPRYIPILSPASPTTFSSHWHCQAGPGHQMCDSAANRCLLYLLYPPLHYPLHSLHRHTLQVYLGPGSVPGTWDINNKTHKQPCPHGT